MKASVIIPTYKDWPRLQLCLDALGAQSLSQAEFEVLVANNNPVADLPPDLRLAGNVRVIFAAQPGSYAARNAALAQAQGEVLFFTDSDCIPDPDWLRLGLDRMADLPETDRLAGGVVLFPAGRDWQLPELYDRLMWLKQESYLAHGWGTTANLIVRKSVFALAGPFDATLFSGGDKEWNYRANRHGSKIHYDPAVRINHPARASFAELAQKQRRVTGGKHKREAHKFKRFLPPIRLLVPSVKIARKMLAQGDLSFGTRLALVRFDYAMRWVAFTELLRLRYFARTTQRQ